MAGQPEREDEKRFSYRMYVARVVSVVVLPVALLGAGLWWVVGNDRVEQALHLQAGELERLVAVALSDGLVVEDGETRPSASVRDVSALDAAVEQTLTSVYGELRLQIVAPDGRLIYPVDTTTPRTVDVGDVGRQALAGVPVAQRLSGGDGRVRYVVPWAGTDGPTAAMVEIVVADDPTISSTVVAVADLTYLFGGAFLALAIALVPLCWWALGEVRRQLRKTRRMAVSDNLTGLANRAQFRERLQEAVAGADRGRSRVGLLMLDLDGFKAINDTGGHAAGDRLLKRVAAALEDATRRNELPCRLGGDEFAVVAPRISSREELTALADRLHERLDINVDFSDGRSLRVTASIGVAVFPDDARDAEELVNVADLSMYAVKARRVASLPNGAQRRRLVR